jgi:hypothetical protein
MVRYQGGDQGSCARWRWVARGEVEQGAVRLWGLDVGNGRARGSSKGRWLPWAKTSRWWRLTWWMMMCSREQGAAQGGSRVAIGEGGHGGSCSGVAACYRGCGGGRPVARGVAEEEQRCAWAGRAELAWWPGGAEASARRAGRAGEEHWHGGGRAA